MTDYVDLEARERDRWLAIDGVGETTADRLVDLYGTFAAGVRNLLGSPNGHHPSIGEARTDAIRDALQAAGYTPPCACEHYDDLRPSQTREDCLAHCLVCQRVLVDWPEDRDGVVDRVGGAPA